MNLVVGVIYCLLVCVGFGGYPIIFVLRSLLYRYYYNPYLKSQHERFTFMYVKARCEVW